MIAFQNPWIKPLIYFFAVSTATLGLFWPEIIHTSISAGQEKYSGRRFNEAESTKITGYLLKPLRNNADELSASEALYKQSASGNGAQVSLLLENFGRSGTNDWPSIKVIYRDDAGRAVREEFLAPANYAHTGTLARSQTISFTISPRAGELSAVFEPVYSQKVQP